MRKTLSADQWVDVRDPATILRKHIRKVRIAYNSGNTIAESMEMGREAILTAIITNWSFEQDLPSNLEDPADAFAELSRTVWYELEKLADDYQKHFGDPDKDKPVDPPEPSTV